MPKKKTGAHIVIPKDSFENADPLGEAYGGDGTGKGAYRMPTGNSWSTYDMFVGGCSVLELAAQDPDGEAVILAEIELMREEMRRRHPGLTDYECDEMRLCDLVKKAGLIDGSAPGLKLVSDISLRCRSLHLTGAQRVAFQKR
jgi:hypothetical protein